jgi:glycolate oxidase FAD binding subunit
MTQIFSPHSEAELASLVLEAHDKHNPLSIQGGGTREPLGRPYHSSTTVSLHNLSGITLYEPSEMIIGAKAGTPLRDIEAALDAKGQMFAFEPMDHRVLYSTAGEPTIGAIAATNASGPRRIIAGAARDSLVGVRFVNGKGEIIKNGGRVMKNVTGLDLVKLQAGAFGTLGVLSEVIFKVLPKQETIATLSFKNLTDAQALSLMSRAMGSPYEVTGAAHLPAELSSKKSTGETYIRIEGFEDSVKYRLGELRRTLSDFGTPLEIYGKDRLDLWRDIRDVKFLSQPQTDIVWRICVKPTDAPLLIADLKSKFSFKHYYDWGGGLIWVSCDAQTDGAAKLIRDAVAHYHGHARLERGSLELRNSIDVFQPLPVAVMQITAGIKKSFDPESIINFGRMYAGV